MISVGDGDFTRDNRTLRGAGMGFTILDSRVSNTIHAGSGSDYQWLFPASGNTITGITHFSAPVVCNGRVYVTTLDNTVYAFGLGQQ